MKKLLSLLFAATMRFFVVFSFCIRNSDFANNIAVLILLLLKMSITLNLQLLLKKNTSSKSEERKISDIAQHHSFKQQLLAQII